MHLQGTDGPAVVKRLEFLQRSLHDAEGVARDSNQQVSFLQTKNYELEEQLVSRFMFLSLSKWMLKRLHCGAMISWKVNVNWTFVLTNVKTLGWRLP